ncbi:MAG: hypothetical protein COA42_18495 [Alteromonadaceae bacterium]|nr:MAG: hypothetical protein COA42_18495 [Alteromonadaceae bacterium]
MCFSATASFTAGGVILLGSAFALKQLPTPKSMRFLACIPIIFALHQLSEGIVWLGIHERIGASLYQAASYFYVLIATAFWPMFIPLSVYMHERSYAKESTPALRASVLLITVIIGSVLSLYLWWSFTMYSPINVSANCDSAGHCHSISYLFDMPYLIGVVDYIYVFIVILPFVLSNNLYIRYLLGSAFLLSFGVALFISDDTNYPSIWCFFAAFISLLIYYVLGRRYNSVAREKS